MQVYGVWFVVTQPSTTDRSYLCGVVCFGIYDLNDDGYISREEMFQMLKSTMVRQSTEEDPDEGTKDLVEIMVKRMVCVCVCVCVCV